MVHISKLVYSSYQLPNRTSLHTPHKSWPIPYQVMMHVLHNAREKWYFFQPQSVAQFKTQCSHCGRYLCSVTCSHAGFVFVQVYYMYKFLVVLYYSLSKVCFTTRRITFPLNLNLNTI